MDLLIVWWVVARLEQRKVKTGCGLERRVSAKLDFEDIHFNTYLPLPCVCVCICVSFCTRIFIKTNQII